MVLQGVYFYRKTQRSVRRTVLVTGGSFHGERGISNFWNFRFVNEDGTLGKPCGDYDNAVWKFVLRTDVKVETRVVRLQRGA